MNIEERIKDLENKIRLYPSMTLPQLIALRDSDLKILLSTKVEHETNSENLKIYADLLNKFYKGRYERQDQLVEEVCRNALL